MIGITMTSYVEQAYQGKVVSIYIEDKGTYDLYQGRIETVRTLLKTDLWYPTDPPRRIYVPNKEEILVLKHIGTVQLFNFYMIDPESGIPAPDEEIVIFSVLATGNSESDLTGFESGSIDLEETIFEGVSGREYSAHSIIITTVDDLHNIMPEGTDLSAFSEGSGEVFVSVVTMPFEDIVVGGDPPIYEDIMVFPTPERFCGSDLNEDGDTDDTILRYQNLETGQVFNTGLIVSDAHHAIDIYENIIAFVGEGSSISYYDISTDTIGKTGGTGFHPSIYGNTIVFASDSTIYYFELNTQTLVDTEISGDNPVIYEDLIAFHANPGPMIWTYDVHTGASVNAGIIGMNATIYESVIAFETSETSVSRDLNSDGDTDDLVICYYNLETQNIINTGVVGIFPALHRSRITFIVPEEDINQDLNGDGKILGNVIHYYDIKRGKVVNTQKLGTEPDIYEDTISFYMWEKWTNQDLNSDGDMSDSIVDTYQIAVTRMAIAGPGTWIFLALLAVGCINAHSRRKE